MIDDDFCVILTASTEPSELVDLCLSHLRESHQNVSSVLITDGKRNDLKPIAQKYNVRFVLSNHLKARRYGALWLQRFFEQAAEENKRVTIKIDCDSKFWRSFNYFPESQHFFGTIHKDGYKYRRDNFYHIQGGCHGYSYDFVKSILDSRICYDNRWREVKHCCAGPEHYHWLRYNPDYISLDVITSIIAYDLGFELFDWPEVNSNASQFPHNDDLKWALTHPHKQLSDW